MKANFADFFYTLDLNNMMQSYEILTVSAIRFSLIRRVDNIVMDMDIDIFCSWNLNEFSRFLVILNKNCSHFERRNPIFDSDIWRAVIINGIDYVFVPGKPALNGGSIFHSIDFWFTTGMIFLKILVWNFTISYFFTVEILIC